MKAAAAEAAVVAPAVAAAADAPAEAPDAGPAAEAEVEASDSSGAPPLDPLLTIKKAVQADPARFATVQKTDAYNTFSLDQEDLRGVPTTSGRYGRKLSTLLSVCAGVRAPSAAWDAHARLPAATDPSRLLHACSRASQVRL